MLEALLLDFDGVLRLWDAQYGPDAERATGLSADAIQRVAFEPRLLASAITGRISDEQWRAEIVAGLGSRYPSCDATQAVRLWSQSPGRIDLRVLELVGRCRRRVKVVLITNATSRLPRDLARLGLSDAFDAVINSSRVGAAKPDPKIYQAAIEAAGATAASSLFVDDSADHVEGACRLGIQGHVFRGSEQLAEALRQYSIV